MPKTRSRTSLSRDIFARVNVVGTSGSGKSTVSKLLAEKLGHPRLEMDEIFWEPNWTEPTDEAFFPRLKDALNKPCWVLDGNYDRTLAIKWERVTAVVWLDFSFSRNFFQALLRAVRRIATQEELWPGTGNRESFAKTFLNKKSILLWMVKNHGKVRRRYAERMTDPRYSHIQFFRLRSPSEVREFLDSIE